MGGCDSGPRQLLRHLKHQRTHVRGLQDLGLCAVLEGVGHGPPRIRGPVAQDDTTIVHLLEQARFPLGLLAHPACHAWRVPHPELPVCLSVIDAPALHVVLHPEAVRRLERALRHVRGQDAVHAEDAYAALRRAVGDGVPGALGVRDRIRMDQAHRAVRGAGLHVVQRAHPARPGSLDEQLANALGIRSTLRRGQGPRPTAP